MSSPTARIRRALLAALAIGVLAGCGGPKHIRQAQEVADPCDDPYFCARWERIFERECPRVETRSKDDARLVASLVEVQSSVGITELRRILGLEAGESCAEVAAVAP